VARLAARAARGVGRGVAPHRAYNGVYSDGAAVISAVITAVMTTVTTAMTTAVRTAVKTAVTVAAAANYIYGNISVRHCPNNMLVFQHLHSAHTIYFTHLLLYPHRQSPQDTRCKRESPPCWRSFPQHTRCMKPPNLCCKYPCCKEQEHPKHWHTHAPLGKQCSWSYLWRAGCSHQDKQRNRRRKKIRSLSCRCLSDKLEEHHSHRHSSSPICTTCTRYSQQSTLLVRRVHSGLTRVGYSVHRLAGHWGLHLADH
jgi:hypothetical protein